MTAPTPPISRWRLFLDDRDRARNDCAHNRISVLRMNRLILVAFFGFLWASVSGPFQGRRSSGSGSSGGGGRKRFVVVAGLGIALIAFAVICGLIGRITATDTVQNTVVSSADGQAQIDALQKQVNDAKTASDAQAKKFDEQNQKVTDLTTKLNDALKALEQAKQQGPVATTATKEDVLKQVLTSQGFNLNDVRIGTGIDLDLARKVTPGGDTFGDPVFTPDALVSLLKKTDDPRAAAAYKAVQECSGASKENLLNPNNYIVVQSMVPVTWPSNLGYVDGNITSSTTTDPAGAVSIFYVGPEVMAKAAQGKVTSLCSFRGHCVNFQKQVFRPTQSTAVLAVYGPPSGTGNGCTANCSQPPCKVNCGGQPPCKVDCSPPCKVDCNPPCKVDCNPPCKVDCQPKEDKCKTQGICGTPDSGADFQLVQDNDPNLVKTTPGYVPGLAEQVIGGQGECTGGTTCGLDPTKYGTEVLDSLAGGKAPGGDTVAPAATSPDNSVYDPSYPVSTNPDLGTSQPVDSSTSEETANFGTNADPLAGTVTVPGLTDFGQGTSTATADNSAPTSATIPDTTTSSASSDQTVGDSAQVPVNTDSTTVAPLGDTTYVPTSVDSASSTTYDSGSVSPADSTSTADLSGTSSSTSSTSSTSTTSVTTGDSPAAAISAPLGVG